jgi:uncharacterized protein (TIGR03083 family)
LAARTGGRALPAAPTISATEAFTRAADALEALLAGLPAQQWRTPVLRDLDVQGLVGHLIGVELDVQRALAGDQDVADIDHIVSTQGLATAQAGRDPAKTRSDWRVAVDGTVALVHGERDDARVVSMHGMRLSADALLVVRSFELWTHENDIRRAVHAPSSVPDPSVLSLMTSLAVQLLPHAFGRIGAAAKDLHLVLTGAGGGTWDLQLGARPAANDVLLVVDAVDFCRLVANRVPVDALELHVSGTGAEHVLAAAASLALD